MAKTGSLVPVRIRMFSRMKDAVDLMSGWDSDREYERYIRNLSGLRRPAIPLPPNFGDGAARLSSPS